VWDLDDVRDECRNKKKDGTDRVSGNWPRLLKERRNGSTKMKTVTTWIGGKSFVGGGKERRGTGRKEPKVSLTKYLKRVRAKEERKTRELGETAVPGHWGT